MGIQARPDGTVVNQGAFEGDSSVLELGTGTAAQINAAIALVPLAQRTHRVVRAGVSDGAAATLNIPARPVGSEIVLVITGGNVASVFLLQEAGVAISINSPTNGNVAVQGFAPTAAAANSNTYTVAGITFTATTGTVCAVLRKIRDNTAATADGWVLLSFFHIAAT